VRRSISKKSVREPKFWDKIATENHLVHQQWDKVVILIHG
jgi:hypothetical protein